MKECEGKESIEKEKGRDGGRVRQEADSRIKMKEGR